MWRFNIERLIALRESKNLSQEAFAARIGTKKQHISQWETGGLTPSTLTIIKISNTFDVSPLYFFTRTDQHNGSQAATKGH
jgi:transcriptional regulator with XRE-family HTH domain